MPPIASVALSDVAVALSTAHAIGVSAGPGAIPVYDSNFSWNPTTKQHVLKGQAVGSGGDRWAIQTAAGDNLVRADLNGTLVHDLSVNTSGLVRKIKAITTSSFDNVYWCDGVSSGANDDGTSVNPVMSRGWNVDFNGAPLDATKPTWREGSEFRWLNIDHYVHEWHIGATITPTSGGQEQRAITLATRIDNGVTGIQFTASTFSILDEASPGNLLYKMQATSTTQLDTTWTIGGVTGASIAISPTIDQLVIGRGTVAPAAFKILGTGAELDWQNNTLEWVANLLPGQKDLAWSVDPVGEVIAFCGTSGTYGQIQLFAPTGQSAGSGLTLFSAGGAHNGSVKLDASGNLLLIPDTTGTLYLAGTFTSFVSPSGKLTTAGLGIQDATDISFATTTGTKIGTATGQKIAFWNATPVVQQVLATGASHTVDDVITLLHTLGLCRQS